jgi:sugar transferase (PEP-CTERM/EpsH1 system associated)
MSELVHKPLLLMHVIHHLHMGGMENGLINLVNHLPEDKFSHLIVCIEDASDFRHRIQRQNVEIIALRRSRMGVWRLRWQLWRLCRQYKPAIVHSRNLSGLDALLPARLARVKYCIHSEHGRDMDDLAGNNTKRIWLRKLHKPFINQYIAVSKDLQNYLTQKVGAKPQQVQQLYNGVDSNRFVPTINKPIHLLPEAWRQQDTIIIGTVGRLQPVKNQAILLHTFASIIKHYPETASYLRLAIIGDGPLWHELQELAETLGLTSKVWLPGKADNIPALLQTFDMFVLPSLMEGISNTILEAMATGLPVLASAVGGNAELIRDGYNGRLFQPNDQQTLFELLTTYVFNAELRKRHGRQARQLVEAEFSLTTMLAKYQQIYQYN